jgi:sialidase-1
MPRVALTSLACLIGILASAEAEEPVFEQTDVFVGGADNYHTYRLPVILASPRGTILVFCDGRRFGAGDLGKIDPVLKRSLDGSKSWSNLQVLQTDPGERTKIGNASAVIDRETGHIQLIFCWNLTRAFSIKSIDDGATFETPVEITGTFRQFPYAWKYFATGHVHGIQLRNGRLVVPVWVNNVPRTDERKGEPQNGVIYSDDHGKTYRAGGLVTPFHQLNEASVFEASDGTLVLNSRAAGLGCRVVARSRDDGMTWTPPRMDENLPCPTCQASTLTLPSKDGKSRVLFSNPATRNSRTRMTVRLSYDDGKTWPVSKQITAGPAGYSDMAVGEDGTIYLAYENGNQRYSERISVARFNLEWLTDGRDSIRVPETRGDWGR